MLIFLWTSWTSSSCDLHAPRWDFHRNFKLQSTGDVNRRLGGGGSGGEHFLLLIAFLNFHAILKIISHIMILRKSTSHGSAAESENEVHHMDIISCVNRGIDGAVGMVLSLPVVAFVFTYFIQLRKTIASF